MLVEGHLGAMVQPMLIRTIRGKSMQELPLAEAGNTEGGSITVLLTSCLAGLESAV